MQGKSLAPSVKLDVRGAIGAADARCMVAGAFRCATATPVDYSLHAGVAVIAQMCWQNFAALDFSTNATAITDRVFLRHQFQRTTGVLLRAFQYGGRRSPQPIVSWRHILRAARSRSMFGQNRYVFIRDARGRRTMATLSTPCLQWLRSWSMFGTGRWP